VFLGGKLKNSLLKTPLLSSYHSLWWTTDGPCEHFYDAKGQSIAPATEVVMGDFRAFSRNTNYFSKPFRRNGRLAVRQMSLMLHLIIGRMTLVSAGFDEIPNFAQNGSENEIPENICHPLCVGVRCCLQK
jgi:hypothetical protein